MGLNFESILTQYSNTRAIDYSRRSEHHSNTSNSAEWMLAGVGLQVLGDVFNDGTQQGSDTARIFDALGRGASTIGGIKWAMGDHEYVNEEYHERTHQNVISQNTYSSFMPNGYWNHHHNGPQNPWVCYFN